MDVKLPAWIAFSGGSLLALALGARPAAADDASSMVFVTASDDVVVEVNDLDAEPAADAAEPAEPSELVIHTDAPPAMAPMDQPAPAPARGDLTVVANGTRSAPMGAIIADAAVEPAAHVAGRSGGLSWGQVLGSGPRRPSPSAGIKMQRADQNEAPPGPASRRATVRVATPSLTDAPLAYDESDEPVQPAQVAARVAAAPTVPAVQRLKSPVDHAKELLVSAYELSLTASNEAEYSQIVQWCATASRVELDVDTRQFTANLSAWALNRRGQCRADEGQTELALADFHAALNVAPENWRAIHNRAVTLAQGGQFAEAFDDLCRVIQLNPKFAKAFANRATLYVQANDFDHALADYDAAIAIDPGLLPALLGRGRVCHLHGKLEDALASFDAAVTAEPTDADIVCSRADLLSDLGRYEDALLDYARAIDLNAKFEHAYRNGAWLLATCPDDSIRDVEGALAGAQAALDCGYGDRHAALDTMAAALANAGRFEEAVGTIQQAIEVAPEDSRAAYLARQQLYEAGQPFRTHPVGAAEIASVDPSEETQSAVYIEE